MSENNDKEQGWALIGERVVWLHSDGTLYVSRGVTDPQDMDDMVLRSDLVVGPYGDILKNKWSR